MEGQPAKRARSPSEEDSDEVRMERETVPSSSNNDNNAEPPLDSPHEPRDSDDEEDFDALLPVKGVKKRGKGGKAPKKKQAVKKGKDLRMTVDLTGMTNGDFLIGVKEAKCGVEGGIMRVWFTPPQELSEESMNAIDANRREEVNGMYVAPNKFQVDAIDEDQKATFHQKLGAFGLFQECHNAEEVRVRLEEIQTYRPNRNENIGWGLHGSVQLEVLSIPKNFVERLSPMDDGDGGKKNRLPAPEDGEEKLQLMMSRRWTPEELLELVPMDPASSKPFGQHTLALHACRWAVGHFNAVASVDKNVCVVDLVSGNVTAGFAEVDGFEIWIAPDVASGYQQKKNGKWERTSTQTIGIRAPKEPPLKKAMPDVLLGELGIAFSQDDLDRVDHSLRGSSVSHAGIYKSCLQKLIRFQPKHCLLENNHLVDSRVVLICVICRLYNSSGQFNPDIGRWMSGLESLTKRLGVILYEDSSFTNDCDAVKLLGAALLAQRVPSVWKPTQELLLMWCRIALLALENQSAYTYDSAYGGEPHTVGIGTSSLAIGSALLDECGSFGGDLRMARHIGTMDDARRKVIAHPQNVRPPIMAFPEHCLDQHTCPSMVYFFPSQFVESVCVKANAGSPFAPLMQRMFVEVTGINPRRHHEVDFVAFFSADREDENNIIQKAQCRMLKAMRFDERQTRPHLRNEENEAVSWEFNSASSPALAILAPDWLAGMIGPIEMDTDKKYLVSCRPSDPTVLVGIPRPSRASKNITAELTQDDKEITDAIRHAKEKLTKHGQVLRDVPAEFLKGCKAFLRKEGATGEGDTDTEEEKLYYDIVDSSGTPLGTWDEVRILPPQQFVRIEHPEEPNDDKGKEEEDCGERMDMDVEGVMMEEEPRILNEDWIDAAFLWSGDGVEENACEKLASALDEASSSVLRRVCGYTNEKGKVVKMNMVSRDGGALVNMVTLADVTAYQLLLRICVLFPAALSVSKVPFTFLVKNRFLFWAIDTMIRNHASRKANMEAQTARIDDGDVDNREWPALEDERRYVEMEHQRESKEVMFRSFEDGVKGSFLYIPVGLGKTYIVMSFLRELQAKGSLPPFVVFALPKSAIVSVIKEVVAFGVKCEVVSPRKSSKYQKSIKTDHMTSVRCGTNFFVNPNVVTIIEDDDLQVACTMLAPYVSQSIFVVDEVHKKLGNSLRTASALELARMSIFFVTLTGTPIIDSKATGLLAWLRLIVRFDLQPRSLWVASNEMIAYRVSTGVFVERHDVEATMTEEEREKHRRLAPIGLHGTNTHARVEDFVEMAKLAYAACTRKMVDLTLQFLQQGEGPGDCAYVMSLELDRECGRVRLVCTAGPHPECQWTLAGTLQPADFVEQVTFSSSEGQLLGVVQVDSSEGTFTWLIPENLKVLFRQGKVVMMGHYQLPSIFQPESVMLVAKDIAHAGELERLLRDRGVTSIKNGSHHMTDASVEKGDPDYKVVIVPLRDAEGYSLTRLGVQISSVYPSNQAKREQMEGRINRLGQSRRTIQYRTVHAGILTVVAENHRTARNLSAALSALAEVIQHGELADVIE